MTRILKLFPLVLASLLLGGCLGLLSNLGDLLGDEPEIYSVEGIVIDTATDEGVEGVEITFDGFAPVETNDKGHFSKGGLVGPTTVTPALDGFEFETDPISLTGAGDRLLDVPLVFKGTLTEPADPPSGPQYQVSGSVTDSNGAGVEGVEISFTGGFASVFTDADGEWKKSSLSGTVTVTAQKGGWTLSESRDVSNASSSVDFTAGRNLDGHILVWRRNSTTFAGSIIAIDLSDRSESTILTFDNPQNGEIAGPIGRSHGLDLSPDGSLFAYTTDRDYELEEAHLGATDYSVYTVDLNGVRSNVLGKVQRGHFLGWGPNGELIYQANNNVSEDGEQFVNGLHVVETDGTYVGELQPVVTTSVKDSIATTSPDGGLVAISTPYTDFKVREGIDGTERTLVSTSATMMSWSPDSKKIVFTGDLAFGLHVVDVVTGEVTRITESYSDNEPAWSPSGHQIAFTRATAGRGIWVIDADGANPEEIVSPISGKKQEVLSWRPSM